MLNLLYLYQLAIKCDFFPSSGKKQLHCMVLLPLVIRMNFEEPGHRCVHLNIYISQSVFRCGTSVTVFLVLTVYRRYFLEIVFKIFYLVHINVCSGVD